MMAVITHPKFSDVKYRQTQRSTPVRLSQSYSCGLSIEVVHAELEVTGLPSSFIREYLN